MNWQVSFLQSLQAIRDNRLRAGVTVFIIALGITALVVVMTTIDGIKGGMSKSFSNLGANTFRIVNREFTISFGGRGSGQMAKYVPITYREAVAFKETFDEIAPVSLSQSRNLVQLKYLNKKTQNNILVTGSDDNYATVSGLSLHDGRNLTSDDVTRGGNVCVIGWDVKETLFKDENPLGKTLYAGGNAFRVVGVYAQMGTRSATGGDKSIVVPITSFRAKWNDQGSTGISVFAPSAEAMDALMGEATGQFRMARKLKPSEPQNFMVVRSDDFLERLLQLLSGLTISAQVIALITLLGASVALLNVMLVSVTERTVEIGLRKALGASRRVILTQFLMEAIVICQMGGLLGIFLGVAVGNLISITVFKGVFVAPWFWMVVGLISCFLVGILAGYYPARKAAMVDPIESLRAI